MVVDDHPIWRNGVARDLAEAGFDVVGTARDAAQALRVAAATRPGVILLDLNLPDLSGAELTSRLLAADSSVRVLVLSASGERQDVLDAVTAGATGYLVKSAEPAELIAAVRTTAAGQAVFTAGLAGLVLGEFRRLSSGSTAAAGPGQQAGKRAPAGRDRPVGGPASREPAPPVLTARETEILRLVATGLTYPQIASRLVLSTRTVQNHVQNTLVKLQLHNKAQLVRYAMEQGIE
ncbi:MAG TPA: response regulator transcription factor [Streptosporangiaceae bacterium]|jgi:DNA-binding NarL/FixJ family response regulator